MKKIIYIIFTFHFSFLTINAQPSITWQRVYPDAPGCYYSSGRGIQPADNGNFYFINQNGGGLFLTQILKINPYGDTIWTKLIDSVAAIDGAATGDGKYVFTGDRPDIYTVKIDNSGNVLWKYIYGHYAINVERMIRTQNNKYVICGRVNYNSGLIAEVDTNGNLLWLKGYPAPFYNHFLTVCEAWNGGYVAAGIYTENEYDPGFGVIIRVDSGGNFVWEKKYFIYKSNKFTTINKINGGYILTPSSFWDATIQRRRAGLIKIDTSGNIVFTKILQDEEIYRHTWYISDLDIIDPNKYIMCGSSTDLTMYDSTNAKVVITDSNGAVIKTKNFKESYSAFSRCYVVNDNDFIFIGLSDYLSNDWYNAYVVRTDTNFNPPPIGIKRLTEKIPEEYVLYQNYPNPFNPVTKIKFDIPKNSIVKLTIYDILGREVIKLVNNEFKQPGRYVVEYNGTNYSSGLYFYRIEIGNYVETKKMVLIK